MPGGQRQRADAAFQRGDALLQHVRGRVHDARVDVALHREAEQVGGVLRAVEGRTWWSGRLGTATRSLVDQVEL